MWRVLGRRHADLKVKRAGWLLADVCLGSAVFVSLVSLAVLCCVSAAVETPQRLFGMFFPLFPVFLLNRGAAVPPSVLEIKPRRGK